MAAAVDMEVTEVEDELLDEEEEDTKDKVYHTFAMVKGEVRRAKHKNPQEFFYCVLPAAGKNKLGLRNMYSKDIPEDWSNVFCHEFSWNKKLPRPTNGNVIEVKIRASKKPNKKGEYTPEVCRVFSIHRNPQELCAHHSKKIPQNWKHMLKKSPMMMGGMSGGMGGMGGGMGMMPMDMMGGGDMMMMGGGGDMMMGMGMPAAGMGMGMPGMYGMRPHPYMMMGGRGMGRGGGKGRGGKAKAPGGKSPGGKAPGGKAAGAKAKPAKDKAAEKEKVAATGIYKSFD